MAIDLKDITNIVDTAKGMELPLIRTGVLPQSMHNFKATGHRTDDHNGILQFCESISGVAAKSDEV